MVREHDPARERLIWELHSRAGVPALGAATVTTDGLEWIAVVGERVRGQSNRVKLGDRWHLGSCTKAVTAVHVARLVEAGHVRWDTTVPELFDRVLPGATHPDWGPITLDQLLTHRAGLPRDLPPAALATAQRDTRLLTQQRLDATAMALATPPDGVGTFSYSNLGYIVAGAAIEQLTGQSWEASVSAHVLSPLGITTAGFGPPTGDQPWGHSATRGGRGPSRPVAPSTPRGRNAAADNPPVMSPAGRLHLSLPDWAKFITLFLTEGGPLLTSSSITRIATAPPGPRPRQAMGWALPAAGAAPEFALGQQGTNTLWVATALTAAGRDRAALVVCNDGRDQLVNLTAKVAADLLRT
ncbi:MAG: serine hydrolase domain-containing protein [Acidimicrobiales bacterium]